MKIYFNLDIFNKQEKRLIKLIVNQTKQSCFGSHRLSFKEQCVKHEKIRNMSNHQNINLNRKFRLIICDKDGNYRNLFTNFFRLYILFNLRAVKDVIYSLLTENIIINIDDFDENNVDFYRNNLGKYDEYYIDILNKGIVSQDYINTSLLDKEIIKLLSNKMV